MIIFIQILTIVGVFALTYILFQALGKPRKNLLYTKEEKENWDKSIGEGLSKWFTATNIVGTLTSLATAYLFFIGSSKLFGYFSLICCVSLWLSSYVTNFFTGKILNDKYLANLFASNEQKGGVISSVFWRPDNINAKNTAKIVKYLSLLNIGAIIWLEFALFSDIAGKLFGVSGIEYKTIAIFTVSVLVIFFALKYGLRGFVFADAFQSPLIFISVFALIVGCVLLGFDSSTKINFKEFVQPIIPIHDCLLFSAHVIFLNLFLILVTEGHWLRTWIFKEKETTMQVKSVFATAIIWLILIFIGLFAFSISGGKIGEDAIVGLLQKLTELSPIFIIAFWVGGVAALFSTADAQIYSFLLVRQFNSETGKIEERGVDTMRPLLLAIIFAFTFAIFYGIMRYFALPFEKIIFLIMPLCLNALPAFVRAVLGYEQKPYLIIISLILYSICSIIGLLQPENQMSWTLSASLMPVLVSIIAVKK